MGSILSSLLGGGATAEAAAATSSETSSSRILSFHSPARWQLHFNNSKDSSQLMVIDFAASWCGPCKFMEPAIHAMASKFTEVEFAKIDVDELPLMARRRHNLAFTASSLLYKVNMGEP
ncbi:hypothetical protein RGQ29_012456 [Quercus rubra]|uniref:Thioredoxin domain-containing protein n=1 Tax=Quercus rubra TaxID=3512 RepID=A0AAN7G1D7_QUERU|nr:hypothetical protein RGQ29_012456 [Quercus rubra]